MVRPRAGVDLSGPEVTCVIGPAGQRDAEIPVLGAASMSCDAVRGGIVLNIARAAETIAAVVREAERSAGCEVAGVAALGVGGSHIRSFAGTAQPCPDTARMVLHRPEAAAASTVEASRAHVRNAIEACRRAGREARTVVYRLQALANGIAAGSDPVLLIAIEKWTCSLAYVVDGVLWRSSELAVGAGIAGSRQHAASGANELVGLVTEVARTLTSDVRVSRYVFANGEENQFLRPLLAEALGVAIGDSAAHSRFSLADRQQRQASYLAALGLLIEP